LRFLPLLNAILDSMTIRSWIIVDQHNEFIWPGPDLRLARDGDDSTVAYGFLPPGLFARVRKLFLSLNPLRGTQSVKRTQ
jgi:hypothetical protein